MERKRITGKNRFIKKVYHKLFPSVFLTALVAVYFFRLFYPQSSIFMIPDFGESDVLHLNLPLKHVLSASLKSRQWPLWTPLLANGFPILAEGQIGTFYLPNLVLFRFLPTVVAFNLNLVIAFFLSAIGTYLFMRKLGFSKSSATFASFVFTFSGFMSVHLNHFNLIQAASLSPLLFLSFLMLWQKTSLSNVTLLAFFLSQQIFTGHFYIVFITLVGIFVFLVSYCFTTIPRCSLAIVLKKTGYLLFGLTLSIFLSSIQLLPTIELWQQSTRSGGLDFDTITAYPYPFKHLFTFVKPYAFGNPASGSYPPFSTDWGIFWENTAYIGIIPLLLALSSVFFFREKIVKIGWVLLLTSLLLVLGKNSPLYFIFSFPPFNLFRVPSKFLLLTTFSLAILAGHTFERILIKVLHFSKIFYSIIIFIIFTLVLLDEYRFSYNYPPVSPAEPWLKIPQTAEFIKNKEGKIATTGAPIPWNNIFLHSGWQDLNPYLYFRESLYPNYNVLFSLPQADINTGGLIPRRTSIFASISENIEIDEEKQQASISTISKNVLSLSSVQYLISPYKITSDPSFLEKTKIEPLDNSLPPFYIYENTKSLPRSYLAFRKQQVFTVEEIFRQFSSESFLGEKKILVENDKLRLNQPKEATGRVDIIASNDTKVILKTKSNTDGILVLADTNYPGWTVSIDSNPSTIETVNLNQRGVFVPSGSHMVSFTFSPSSFEVGKKITIFSHLIIFLAVFLDLCFSPRTSSGNIPLSCYPENKRRN